MSCPYYFSHSACVNSFMFSLSFASPICSCMFVFVLLFYSTHYNHYKSFVINLSTANYIITTTTLHTYWLGSLAIPPGSCNLWQSLSYCSMGPTHGIVPANGHRSWFSFSLILPREKKTLLESISWYVYCFGTGSVARLCDYPITYPFMMDSAKGDKVSHAKRSHVKSIFEEKRVW